MSSQNNKAQKIEKQEKVSIAIPMAIANWLVANTSLTFDQIADFCDIHPATIQNLSNKDTKTSVIPKSPVGIYLTEEEIERCTNNKNARLKPMRSPIEEIGVKKPKEKKYVSMIKKRNRLDAAMWMHLFYPEVSAATIAKLVKSTSKTVNNIKKGTYKGIEKLVPKNPVTLGFCTKEDLERATKKNIQNTEVENK